MSDRRKDATTVTQTVNAQVLNKLPFQNTQDFEDAQRGFIPPLPENAVIKNSQGLAVWDISRFTDFIKEDAPAPDTVNPSLWRQSQLTLLGGLYQVTDRMYQVRNADLSNLTIGEGDTGIIIFDDS